MTFIISSHFNNLFIFTKKNSSLQYLKSSILQYCQAAFYNTSSSILQYFQTAFYNTSKQYFTIVNGHNFSTFQVQYVNKTIIAEKYQSFK